MIDPENDLCFFRAQIIPVRGSYFFCYIDFMKYRCIVDAEIPGLIKLTVFYFSVSCDPICYIPGCQSCKLVYSSVYRRSCLFVKFFKDTIRVFCGPVFVHGTRLDLIEHRHIRIFGRGGCAERVRFIRFVILSLRHRQKGETDSGRGRCFKYIFSRSHRDFIIIHELIVRYIIFVFRIYIFFCEFRRDPFSVYDCILCAVLHIEPYIFVFMSCSRLQCFDNVS